MPVYNLTSQKTGRVYPVNFDSEPSESDVDEAISHFDLQAPAGLKPSTQQTLAEQESFAKQFRAEAAKSLPEKSLGLAKSVATAGVVDPVMAIARAIVPTGEIAGQFASGDVAPAASTIAESGRRIGMDVLNLIRSGVPAAAALATEATLRGKGSPLMGAIPTALARLQSRTPTQEEITQAFEAQIANRPFEEARTQVPNAPLALGMEAAFERANPQAAEALTQITELAVPVGETATAIKGALKGTAQTVKNAPRAIRSIIKPSNPRVGDKLETALENRFSDIYATNPEAHTTAATPFEGLGGSIDSTIDDVSEQLDVVRSAAGQTNEAGAVLAQKLRDRVDALRASGGKADDITALEQRATEIQGITTTKGLQDAVTEAGRKVDWNQPRTRVQEVADQIIHTEGGKELNKLFEQTNIPGGAEVRKKWGELRLIQEEYNNRLNKLINQAPKNVRPALFEALGSTKGLAGTIALLQGYASGAIALGVAGAETWIKKVAKDLKDPNIVIRNIYEDARVNPPTVKAAPVARPPVIPPPNLNAALQRAMTPEELNALPD